VSHSTCTHSDRIDSRLLVVGSQTASLAPDPSFNHNLCWRCPNGSCEVILDIYTSRPFQQYKKHLNARCFDPCNHVLNFRESWRTSKSHFRECEWRPHTSLKVGLRHNNPYSFFTLSIYDYFQIHVYINDVYNSENKLTMDNLLKVPSIYNDNIHYTTTIIPWPLLFGYYVPPLSCIYCCHVLSITLNFVVTSLTNHINMPCQ